MYSIKPNTTSIEDLLRSTIKHLISDLTVFGGATRDEMCRFVHEEAPELYNAVGSEHVLALFDELHGMEDIGQSDWYTARLHRFNKRYFDGRFDGYCVRAVYDPNFWSTNDGHIDVARRQILLPVIVADNDMDRTLIVEMVHAATNTTTYEGAYRAELERLRKLGAPVSKRDLGDRK
jgi:hypothetical protein